MASIVRYRTGIDGWTGKVLTGPEHLAQSLETLWLTRRDQLVMALDFGTDLRAFLAEDLTPVLALGIYNELAMATYEHEPEYRLDELQFMRMSASGMLALRHGGLYYPEGRFGNYEIAVPFNASPVAFMLGGAAR